MDRPMEILLVEDNPGDARLTMEAFKEASVPNNLSHVPDGVEALAFLRREGDYASAPRPDLILLDLNLPRKLGREVLAELKGDNRFRRIPVIVLTTSQSMDDVQKAYGLGANCYVSKPVDLNQFMKAAKGIEDFWLKTVTLSKE